MTEAYPPLDELLLTVRDFLLEIRPRLDGAHRYHAQVAAYLLEIAQRELQDRSDMEKLRTAMRSGALDAREDELRAALLTDVIAAVAVTRPDHLHPGHRRQPL
jgi:hypothetical protein